MTFRLAKYYERLRSYVEAAIDEYKMEQEYQTFIQSLRDYVMSKEPMLDHVHIVHDGYFVLWELKSSVGTIRNRHRRGSDGEIQLKGKSGSTY